MILSRKVRMGEQRLSRSETMRRIKGKDTSPEKAVRSMLHRMGYRFRLHREDLPGRPDIVFPSRQKVVFVNGCFWHGHGCARGARTPKTNRKYWVEKISKNMKRDKISSAELRRSGWKCLVVWECRIKNRAVIEKALAKFLNNIG